MCKKRIVSILLALLLVVTMFPTAAFAASAMKVAAEQVTVEAGAKTANVKITVSNNPGVAFLNIKVGYNSSVMTLQKVLYNGAFDQEDFIAGNVENNPYTIQVSNYSANGCTANGTMMTLQFAIKDNAKAGTYDITLSNAEAGTINEEEVDVNLTSGSVTIAAAEEDEHTHAKRTFWTTNDTYHWHGCTDFSCDMVWDKEKHADKDANGICDVCQYFASGTYYGAVCLSVVSGEVGDTVEIPLELDCWTRLSTLKLRNLTYNTKALRFNGFKNYESNQAIADGDFNNNRGTIDITFRSGLASISNTLCTLSFTILDGATAESYDITFDAELKYGSSALTNIGIQKGTVNIIGNTGASCTFSDEWSYDETHHWHECTDRDCDEVSDYERHDFGDWKVTVEPTDEEDGERERTCEVCDYTQTEEVEADDDNDDDRTNPFIDILLLSSGSNRAIEYVYENGLFEGVSRNEFAPHMTMTRGMFVTVLGRMAGINEEAYYGSSFSDVQAGEWYAPGVAWASQNGIVKGYGDGTFGVNDEVTVEQAVVILARYAEYLGIDTASDYLLTKFSDRNHVSAWAFEQMQWAVEQGVYDGNGKSLVPQKSASRELVATLIYNFAMEYVE